MGSSLLSKGPLVSFHFKANENITLHFDSILGFQSLAMVDHFVKCVDLEWTYAKGYQLVQMSGQLLPQDQLYTSQ
jgi:hypothetical protein